MVDPDADNGEVAEEKPSDAIEPIRSELAKGKTTRTRRISEKVLIAALGAIPWVGGFIAALAAIRGEEASVRADDLQTQWIEEHEKRFSDFQATMDFIAHRLESLGPEIEQRVQSPEYLALVRQSFRVWDSSETDEKRKFVANLVVNSAGTRVCSDDVVRLFITWLDLYHEIHFAVIRQVYDFPLSSRYAIWIGIYGESNLPREDSAEADLYKLLIRDLSTGGVIRQVRETDGAGRFVRKRPVKRRGQVRGTLESAFEDAKEYVLTDLGRQFVHYTMSDAVTKLGSASSAS